MFNPQIAIHLLFAWRVVPERVVAREPRFLGKAQSKNHGAATPGSVHELKADRARL
jgi:hypothetical protein